MNRLEKILKLNSILLEENPQSQAEDFSKTEADQLQLLRALMNVRDPAPISQEFLDLQDEILREEIERKGIVEIGDKEMISFDSGKIFLWQGDITRLKVDAIVNAANSAMLGCFIPLHNCIDNAIHSAAGIQLRNTCDEIMNGNQCETGDAIITPGFNLPARFVIHTVGPIISHDGLPNRNERDLLAKCYESCLNLAHEKNLSSVAFCCISTGVFRFDNKTAAEVAIKSVRKFSGNIRVVFNVFKTMDLEIYKHLLR